MKEISSDIVDTLVVDVEFLVDVPGPTDQPESEEQVLVSVVEPDVTIVTVGIGPSGPPGPQGLPGPAGTEAAQVSFQRIAGTTVLKHRVVVPDVDGTVIYADNATAAHVNRPLWLTLDDAMAGESVEVLAVGTVVDPTWSWSVGVPVYLGAEGLLTQEAPGSPLFLRQIGVAGPADTVFVDPGPLIQMTAAAKVEQQRYFIATSGVVTLNDRGFFRGLFTNPAGSDRTMRWMRMVTLASHGPVYVEIFKNPTTGLPTGPLRPVTNAHLGAVFQSMAELRMDVTTGTEAVRLGGGVDTGWVFPVAGGQPLDLDLPPLLIPPGTSIGINVRFIGAADVTMSLFFLEE